MSISSNVDPYLITPQNPPGNSNGADDLINYVNTITPIPGNNNSDKINWINGQLNTNYTQNGVTKTLEGWIKDKFSSTSPQNYGIVSYSNLGDLGEALKGLKSLEQLLSDHGGTQSQAMPVRSTTTPGTQEPEQSIQHTIPAAAGSTTVVIQIYSGGSVTTAPPSARVPGAVAAGNTRPAPVESTTSSGEMPTTSGPTQTIDASMSKLINDLQTVKSLKENFAEKLQQMEGLQIQIQMKIKEIKEAQKKEREQLNREKNRANDSD